MTDKGLYLIDATAFCYRAFYGLKGLSTSYGQPTNAIYGFVNILNKILKQNKPQLMVACFDVSRDTFRQKKFIEYKIQRPPMPDGLSSQIPLIKEIVSALGITICQKQGYEADDIIATLTKKARAEDLKVTIVSSDKDILQLVDKDVLVFSPYKDEGTIYDQAKVKERFGIMPKQIADIISLMGDSADNIPGVAGIGEKTAVDLIKDFGSLGNLLANLDKVKSEKVRDSLRESLQKIQLNRELVALIDDIDLEFKLSEFKIKEPDTEALFKLYKRLEFKLFLKGLNVEDLEESGKERALSDIKELPHLLKTEEELVLYAPDADNIYFTVKDKFFQASVLDEKIKLILADPKIKKTGHDLKKIRVLFKNKGVDLNGLYFDTMIASYLINPSKSEYTITELAWDYLGKSIKPESLDNLRACSIIKELKLKLENDLKEKELTGLFKEIEMPLVEVLAQVELTGIKIDLEKLKALSREIEKRLIKLIAEIYKLSGTEFNINSPKQLGDILFNRLSLPVVKKTKTGPSTDEEVLRALSSKHKLPAFLLEYRQLVKLKNTYIDALPDLVDAKTGRLHTSFNQTGTETGRLSSSKPNLQNIPIKTDLGKSIREAVIAFSKDSFLMSCDYSQIELRIMAHMSKDQDLTAAFKENKDIHKATAALIFNCQEKDVTDQMRDVAKRINFGIIYGLSAYGLSRDLEIPHEQAQEFIDAYFSRYYGVKEYIEQQIQRAESDGFVSTILGRRRYLPEINNKNQAIRQLAQRQAVNTPLQGSASDLIKKAMIDIYHQISKDKFEAKMILQIHDELLFDLPKKEVKEFTLLVKDKMENVLKLDVPIRVDVKVGKNWAEMEGI